MPDVRLTAPVGTPAYAALRDQLRKDIVSGAIPNGTRLTVFELVRRYGVSQMPIREALQALQGEGLVNILPHRGARVLSLDAKFIRNVYSIRTAVELLLASSSLPNIGGDEIHELEAIQKRFALAAQHGDADEVFALNREFHYTIYRHADNDEAVRIYDHYNALIGALRRVYDFGPARRERMVAEHEDTLAALRSRDGARLTSSIRAQCERGLGDVLASMGR